MQKQKKCKCGCGQLFTPLRPMQPTTEDFECRVRYAEKVAEKSRAAREKKRRAEIRERKQKLKTRSDYIKEAQIAFNAYIRYRDNDRSCPSCGRPLAQAKDGVSTGGEYDCGHYRSVGSAPHLRFDERNAHGQCKQCNRYGAGRAVDYRVGLIKRIGLEAVESLEADQSPKHYTVEELMKIKNMYKKKLRELRSKNDQP